MLYDKKGQEMKISVSLDDGLTMGLDDYIQTVSKAIEQVADRVRVLEERPEPSSEFEDRNRQRINDIENRLKEMVMSKKTEAITNGLKACPFCGGVSKRFNSKDMFFVSCSECFMKTEEFIRMEFAIHKWNKRV